MNRYGILSRKRAVIALAYTVVFGLFAVCQLSIRQHPLALLSATGGKFAGPIALTTIYFIVTAVLLIMACCSRCSMEPLYFGFGSTSAGIGLLRSLLGDPTACAELGARVTLLGCAVVTGTFILRDHGQSVSQFAD